DQTLRREKHDLTIQVSTVQKTAAPEGPADVLWGRAESPAPARRIALFRCQRDDRPGKGRAA
ncbi:MAG: hypothetical protein IKS83_08010, partial [Victivallales bacterium]|nr:hypothetical protein [Victivallales bacterium]